LIEREASRSEFLEECRWHSQNFARFIQNQLGHRYGLAEQVFPEYQNRNTAYALHPYYRESRRLVGLTTVREQDILPVAGGRVASLNIEAFPPGVCEAIAIGNYANDHHYPGVNYQVQPKSIRWGGRWTGTPFTIGYRCLIPAQTDGLLVCEKNISVSHITNGATRLQPVVMGIGQAAGMAAAMCVELNTQPRDLPVRKLQNALLQDLRSPAAIIPLFNLPPDHPEWLDWQLYYLDNPDAYPATGNCPISSNIQYIDLKKNNVKSLKQECFRGIFHRLDEQDYRFSITTPVQNQLLLQLVTLRSHIDEQLQNFLDKQPLQICGHWNRAGNWLLVEHIQE
jgi:hypothetical protein